MSDVRCSLRLPLGELFEMPLTLAVSRAILPVGETSDSSSRILPWLANLRP